jgi:hypothetical protein
MNARYLDQAKQARVLHERRTMNEQPVTKVAEDPLDYESLSPENSPYRIDEREGPGTIPLHVQSKSFPDSDMDD